jgi:hypothetical protein
MRSAVPDGASTLVPVVGLEDLDVVAFSERSRRDFEQAEHHVHPDAEVRRHGDRDGASRFRNARALALGEPGRPDHHFHAFPAADGEVLEGTPGSREIDQHVATADPRRDVVGHLHAAG